MKLLRILFYGFCLFGPGFDSEIVVFSNTVEESLEFSKLLEARFGIETGIFTKFSDIVKYDLTNIQFIVDTTFSRNTHLIFETLVESYGIPVIIIDEGKNKDLVFYTFPEESCKFSVISIIFEYFSVSRPGVVWEISDNNLKLLEFLINSSFKPVYQANVKEGESYENLFRVVGRTLKSQGLMTFLFLNSKIDCRTFENVLEEQHLEKKWNLAIYFDQCVYQINKKGSFVIVHESVIESMNQSDYLLKSIFGYISNIEPTDNTLQVYKKFKTFNPKCQYILGNYENKIKKVAIVDDKNLTQLLNFTYFTENQRILLDKPLIEFSANTGTQNPPGYSPTFQNSKFQRGTYFGVSYINSLLSLLPHHDLFLYDQVSCGINIFNYSYSKSCFESISASLGVAYIPPFYTATISVLKLFQDLSLDTPFISGFGSNVVLSNSSMFPNYKRMCSSIEYITHVYSRFIYIMGWEKIVLFYSNEAFGQSINTFLLQEQANSRYSILNSEKYREIDYFVNSSHLEKYKENIKNAVETNCNIFFLAMSDPCPFNFVELLYDYGLRRGDIQIVLFTLTSPSVFLSAGDPAKRAELLFGSFTIFNAAWVGDYGQEIYKKFVNSSFGIQAPVPSFYIDVVLSIAYTSQLMINRGDSPEDSKSFMQELRNVRFLGTSGTISFDRSSNDRNLVYFFIYNYYETSGNWITDPVAIVDPLSSVYFKVLKAPVWASGSFPSDLKPMYLDCDFPEEKVKFSNTSFTLQISVFVFVFIISVCLVLYDVSKLPKGPIDVLDSKKVPQLEDMLMFWFVFIEGFQFISIGPTSGQLSHFLSSFADLLSLKFTKSHYFRNHNYWLAFNLLIGSGYLWILFFFISHIPICRYFKLKLKQIVELATPIMANYLFIPIISGLFSILSCDQAIGDSLKSSFFFYDCSVFCWTNTHLDKVVQSLALLTFYVPISIYYRTRWQEHNSEINFKASSSYLILKNILLMALLIFEKLVKPRNETLHSLLFIFIILFITLQVFCKNAFNYDRANLWVKVMMVCVVWNCGTCIVLDFIEFNKFGFLGLQLAGWIIALNVGIYLHSKLPEDYLDIGEDHSITDLFHFALSTKKLKPIVVQSEGNSIEIETHRSQQVFVVNLCNS